MTTRFGIIGTGRITRRLVADLQSTAGVTVTVIASRDDSRAKWFADQYGIANGVGSYEVLLNREDVDAVYIALPPALHTHWSIQAANAGKQILCEKPLALRADDVNAIISACEQRTVRWLDATAWLHHERTAAIREILNSGRLGNIGHISTAVSFFRPFQSGEHRLDASLGGGCLLDLGWYCTGLMRFVTRSMPREVFASAVFERDVPIRVQALLWFDNGITATLSCGFDTATRKWCEVAGEVASIVCDDFTRPWLDKPARIWIHDAAGTVEKIEYQGSQERAMISRLIGDEPLDEYWSQARHTQMILDALQRSIATDRRVVLTETERS
jgi:predicted dehydrogenase